MLSLEEYDEKISGYIERLKTLDGEAYNKLLKEISSFQNDYMENVLKEYEKTIGNSEAKKQIYCLMSYAVRISESGSSIVYVDSLEVAEEIDKIIWEEIGDYLLDYQVYEENGSYVVDCMFGGNYVPYWDGWEEI